MYSFEEVKNIFIMSGIKEEESVELAELCFKTTAIQMTNPIDLAYKIAKVINAK